MPKSFEESSPTLKAKTVQDSLEETLVIHNDGLEQFYKLREKWSFYIALFLFILIAFQIILTLGVGLNWFNFSEYEWFIKAVLVGTFLQIVGMGLIIVKFLFAEPKKEGKKKE